MKSILALWVAVIKKDFSQHFNVVTEVTISWDKLIKIANYKENFGKLLIEKSGILSLPNRNDNKNYKTISIIDTLDLVVHMLGPDLDIAEEYLFDIGYKLHAIHGI